MRFNQSIFTLVASLCVILMFVVSINLTTGTQANAGDPLTQLDDASQNSSDDETEESSHDDDVHDDQEEDEMVDEEEGDQETDEDEEWDDEEEGEEEEELELHAMHLEVERVEIELNIGRLDLISRMRELAEDRTAMASFAIMHAGEFLEGEEAINVFEGLLKEEAPAAVKNLIKMKLAEFYAQEGRESDVERILKSMILGN